MNDCAHMFGLMREGKLQPAEKLEDHGKLHGDLQEAAGDGSPSGDNYKRVLRAAGAEGDHARDHGDIPEDGCRIGDEELAVTVENTEAPSGSNKEAGAGEEDAHEKDGKFAFFAAESRGDGFNQPRSGENTEKYEHRSAQGEQSGDCAGRFARFFLIAACKQAGVNGNEGGRKDTFAEKILQEVGNAESSIEGVSDV